MAKNLNAQRGDKYKTMTTEKLNEMEKEKLSMIDSSYQVEYNMASVFKFK